MMRIPALPGLSGHDRRAATGETETTLHAGDAAVFRIHGLTKTYGSGNTEVVALREVSLSVASGQVSAPRVALVVFIV